MPRTTIEIHFSRVEHLSILDQQGYVALEMGTVYASLGSRVTLAARGDKILRSTDEDLVLPLFRKLKERFEHIHFNTRATSIHEKEKAVEMKLEGEGVEPNQTFDRVLVAVGQQPNSMDLGLEAVGVKVDDKGS